MGEETTTITRSKAIILINDSIENFFTYYDSYCCENRDAISEDEKKLHEELCDVIYILRNDDDYKNDLKIMPLEHLTQFLYMCKEMVENNDLFTKYSYPKGNILIVENENSNPELIEKALKNLEQHGDERIKNAIKEYHAGDRQIRFSKMPENQNGLICRIDDRYSHFVTENLMQDTPENQIQVAITLAHEFKRNATTDSIEGETREVVLEDTKIIESFANTYGEEIYQKFPEYGILHYIKKIFGETELQDFADFAFDSTGNYWKVNNAGDLIDDGNAKKVFDRDGKEQPLAFESKNTGRQGTLEKWLGLKDAFTALLKSAGYKWNGAEWIENPGKIDHKVIEKAYEDGKLTDDQYNMIQLAAGIMPDAEQKKESLFKAFLEEIQKANRIKTQIQVDIVNRAWEFFFGKKTKSKKSANNSNSTSNQRSKTVELSELDRFIEIVRNTVGASYDHARSPTETKMDCSGVFVYAMKQLGYKIDKHLTAARMASGQIPGIILYEMVDNDRQGNKGVLNFYKWGTSTVQHVNYGVGQNENEIDLQIIDASEGDTWQTIRNNNEKQVKKAKKNTVNQTWAPFSTKTKPDIQAYLDFSKFNKEIEIK